MLLRMQETEAQPCPETPDPLEVEPTEPRRDEVTIAPEPLPDEPEAEEAEPFEFDRCDDPSPTPLPVLPVPVRIASLRPLAPATEAILAPVSPPPPRPACTASVTNAVPRGECRPPRYPAAAQRLGQEGHVLVLVRVGTDGTALSVEIEESSGYPVLDEAAMEAVRDWTFEPAREDGRAVESLVHVPFRFRLRA